jgi:hypothetical protein
MTENTGSRLPEHQYHRFFMHFRAGRTRLAVIAAMLAGTLGHAQGRVPAASLPKAPPDTIERWVAAVNAHAAGELDQAAKDVAAWPDDHLAYTYNQLTSAVLTLSRRSFADARAEAPVRRLGIREPEDVARLFKRGATLHADIAMLAPDHSTRSRQVTRGAPGGSSVLMRDGETMGLEANPVHWTIGRVLISGIQPVSSRIRTGDEQPASVDPFARHWYRATTAYLSHRLLLSEALAHTNQVLASIPDDPVLLLMAGALHENFGSRVIQAAIKSVFLPPGLEIAVGSAGTELSRARQLLERAIAADPSSAEAHIRLGYVIGQREDHAGAARELRRGEDLAVDPRWKYFAALFLGQELEQLHQHADARDAYERAAALYPRAQSPRLALGRLAAELGDRDATAAANRALLSLPADAMVRDDPWWSYEIRAHDDLQRWLAEYYAIARAVR